MDRTITDILVKNFGEKYSKILGIDLTTGEDVEIFKWFLASILFGAPIGEPSVIKTYGCFETRDVLTPQKILDVAWEGLVEILDDGGYTRYDFKTSDKLLTIARNLVDVYEGSLSLLHEQSLDPSDLEKRIKNLGKGIGEVTVSIFLRELRNIWKKADPKPTPLVILAAKNLGITKEESPKKALKELKEFWKSKKIAEKSFVDFETALLRLGKNFCRKEKCAHCMLRDSCQTTSSASSSSQPQLDIL